MSLDCDRPMFGSLTLYEILTVMELTRSARYSLILSLRASLTALETLYLEEFLLSSAGTASNIMETLPEGSIL